MSQYVSVTRYKVRVLFLDKKDYKVKYDMSCGSLRDAYRLVKNLDPNMYVRRGKKLVKSTVTYHSLQKHLKRDIIGMAWFNVTLGDEPLIAHVKVE